MESHMTNTEITLQADFERADDLVAKMMMARDEAVDALCDANYELHNAFQVWGALNDRIRGASPCEQLSHPAWLH
jgi:hypothetical protein